MQLDGLGRTVPTIQNYQDGLLNGDPSDRDLIARSVYDKAGRRTQTIDAAGRVTQFAYDNADRLIGVTENAVSGACPHTPCNVVTSYSYDRAGNRIKLLDSLNHARTFTYNAADEQTAATDAMGRSTSWDYDAA